MSPRQISVNERARRLNTDRAGRTLAVTRTDVESTRRLPRNPVVRWALAETNGVFEFSRLTYSEGESERLPGSVIVLGSATASLALFYTQTVCVFQIFQGTAEGWGPVYFSINTFKRAGFPSLIFARHSLTAESSSWGVCTVWE
jgi:hypothetical protein